MPLTGHQPPGVSVVLPVRNAAQTILSAVNSIRAQSESRWELIIVDDGSTDDTPRLLTAVAREDSRIHILSTPPAGIVKALNLGLAHARAPFIARMDADDVSHPHRLEKQLNYLQAHPTIGLVSCLVEFKTQNSTTTSGGYQRHVEWLNTVVSSEGIRRRRFVESPLAHPSVMFRQGVVARHGPYAEGEFPEDYELWLRWMHAGVAMAKVPETLLVWHDRADRLSRTCSRYSVEAFYRLKARYLALHLQTLPAERPVWIWGAGRVTRRRAEFLFQEGLKYAGWIDIDPRKIGKRHAGLEVRAPETLLSSPRPFVLAYVAKWEAREIISGWLDGNGFVEERDYLLCA